MAKRVRRGQLKAREANKTTLMTEIVPGEAVPTDDPFDAGHDSRDENGFLKTARQVPHAEPRCYPPGYMLRKIRQWMEADANGCPVMRRAVIGYVSFETEMEETAERERRLEDQELLRPMPTMAEEMRRAMGYGGRG